MAKWSGWRIMDGYLVNILAEDEVDGWIHILETMPDEQDPDNNHVHYKFKAGEHGKEHSHVLCKVKVDGMSSTNRRRLIDKINKATGLNLSYR